MNPFNIEDAVARKKAQAERARAKENHVGSLLDKEALDYMAEHFGCNDPAFLPTDNFDSIAAMRRDSFRAFYLTLCKWHKRSKKIHN